MVHAQYFDNDELPAFITRRDRRERKLENRKIKQNRRKQYPTSEYEVNPQSLKLRKIEPLTDNQRKVFEAYASNQNLLLHGVAGTGKTFIALYLALEAIQAGKAPKPIVILRSIVPGRDGGFLPGKIEEKAGPYETPYFGLCSELSGHPTAYQYMKDHGYIQFSTTSYLRGLTFHNNTIIVDECQNMSFQELDTIMTRVGEGCRIIFCGDFRQTDLQRDEERKGLHKFMDVVRSMASFESVEFTKDDVVRSGLVREYIMAKLNHGII